MYGAFIIHKRKESPMPEFVMVLSDWANEKPSQIHRSLHNATDWYAIKKGSTQNYGAALMNGHFKTKLTNEWKRMLPMDVSDVYYNRFLINGMSTQHQGQFKKGEKVRLRIINGSASSNFWLQYAGGKMAVVGSMDDMGMNMSLQQMDMNTVMYPEVTGDQKPMNMEGMKHAEMYPTLPDDFTTLNYAMLRANEKTTLPKASTKILNFELTGNMNRYVWTIDNKTVSEADKILIKKGENVRIVLYKGSMMRHPMHLHGHFFRVLNGLGDYAPLKNVIDIMPMETDTLEFAATESGDWFFHCHILYHMMSGMGRIFSYENSPPNPELPHPKKSTRKLYRDDREFHAMAHIGLESTGSDGEFMLANTRWILQTEWRLGLDDHHGYESESHMGRYIGRNQFFLPYVGWDYRYRAGQEIETDIFGQTNTKDSRKVFCAGFRYTLPMFLIADFRVDHEGQFRMQLSREDIAVTNRLRLGFMVNSDREYMVGGRYILTKYISLSSHYDSDMGLGAGLIITY